eukprot:CAMPEP_0194508292 /NCGR_PEP_ID=MMETSP0253-20130528/38364_1 /TAXON_ID=2966 /ORGANISM="Noctiluca scintillans" /LENGTH=129 /DNA_ID=CAMNT_0039351305 /DNA_START=14 /DNA_END=403 /DNA_ORIENTATION=-
MCISGFCAQTAGGATLFNDEVYVDGIVIPSVLYFSMLEAGERASRGAHNEEHRNTARTLRRRSRSNSSTLHFPLRRSRSSSLGSVISDVADDHFVDAPVVVSGAFGSRGPAAPLPLPIMARAVHVEPEW